MQFTREELFRWCDTHQTTPELAQAILENARDDVHADAIWMAADDDADLWRKIETRAWTLVDKSDEPDRQVLHCGEGRFQRQT